MVTTLTGDWVLAHLQVPQLVLLLALSRNWFSYHVELVLTLLGWEQPPALGVLLELTLPLLGPLPQQSVSIVGLALIPLLLE